MAAFAEMYDGVSAEEGCMVASRDDTTINTLRVVKFLDFFKILKLLQIMNFQTQ